MGVKMTKNVWLLAMLLATASAATARPRTIPCERVFVTGTQTHEIAWALQGDNLRRLTCMQPVRKPEEADAILDIEIDPKTSGMTERRIRDREDAVASGNYWVDCRSDARGGYCLDSSGYALETACDSRGCSSYYGPSGPTVALQAIGDALVSWSEQRSAWAYMFTSKGHELIWKYEGVGTWRDDLQAHAQCQHKSFVMGRGCR